MDCAIIQFTVGHYSKFLGHCIFLLQDILPACPYADADDFPKKAVQSNDPGAIVDMADGKGCSSRQSSATSFESSMVSSASTTHSELTKYIALHYNPSALRRVCKCLKRIIAAAGAVGIHYSTDGPLFQWILCTPSSPIVPVHLQPARKMGWGRANLAIIMLSAFPICCRR